MRYADVFSSMGRVLVGLCCLISVSGFCLTTESVAEAKGSESTEEVSQEISEAFSSIKSYSFSKKEEFLQWAEAHSEELDKRIAELEKRLAASNEKMREELLETWEGLSEERKKLARELRDVRKGGKAAWEDAKWGLSAAMEKLDRTYEQAKSRFDAEQKKDN